MAIGHEVDRRLETGDVRLTIGGEPTFVSIDDMDDPQWTTDAVGEDKRVLSNLLLLRLRDQFAPGGLLHYGQGKWYPGEPLPRWALTCLWRRDGEPIWNDPQWMADEGTDYGHTHDDAQRFIGHLSRELNISAEDDLSSLRRYVSLSVGARVRLPIDTDPLDPKLEDPNERATMIRSYVQSQD